MTTTTTTTTAAAPPDYTDLLDRVIRAGAKLVDEIVDGPAIQGQSRGNDYAAVSRSIRQSVMLVARLHADAQKSLAQIAAGARRRAAARKQILRTGQDAIQHCARGPSAENLRAELLERLDSPDLEEDLGDRPTAEIVAEIVQDLRVVANQPGRFARRTPDDLRVLGILAAAPAGQTAARAATLPRPTEAAPPTPPELPDLVTMLRYESHLRDHR